MVRNPPEGYQRIIPYLLYEDAATALEFLCRAFGFEVRESMEGENGTLMHAEVACRDNVLILATAVPAMGHASPRSLPARHAMVACYVDDVDAHFAQAKAAGADIRSDPEDQFYGDRSYRVRDPEGHEWCFMTHVRDVPPEAMKPPGS